MPLPNDIIAWIQAREVTPELASITLDEIRQAQADDDSFRPVLHTFKDQVKPLYSDLRQYPEDTRVLLSQWDLLILQEGVLYRKFDYPDGTMNFCKLSYRQSFIIRISNGFMPTLGISDGRRLAMRSLVMSTFLDGVGSPVY